MFSSFLQLIMFGFLRIKTSRRLFPRVAAAFFCCQGLWGQQQPLEVEYLGTRSDSFPKDEATCMLMGRYGFLWLGTQRGLFRYGGTDLRWYRHDPTDDLSISSEGVRVLFEDKAGNFWVGTSSGLNKLDRKTGNFTRYMHDPRNPGGLMSGNIWCLYQDRRGLLWVGTDLGLMSMGPNGIEQYDHERGLIAGGVTAVAEDRFGSLWAGTEKGGLFYWDPTKKRFEPHPELGADGMGVIKLHRDRSNRLWVGTRERGLYCLDRRLGEAPVHYGPDSVHGLGNPNITAVASDWEDQLWVGTRDGLFISRPDGSGFLRFSAEERQGLRDEHIKELYGDPNGLLWIATPSGGLEFVNLNRNRFGYFGGEVRQVQAMCRDSRGVFWLAMKFQGLSALDLNTGRRETYLPGQTIRSLLPGDDILWLGEEKGLYRFDLATRRAEALPEFQDIRIWRIVRDLNSEDLWLGTGRRGVIRYNPVTGKTVTIGAARDVQTRENGKPEPASYEKDRYLSSPTVISIVPDPNGMVWIGTYGGGLNRLDPDSGQIKHFRKENSGLTSDEIVHVYRDRGGIIWIGTLGGGLNRFEPESERFESFTLKTGFLDNAVTGVSEDDYGNLWVTTGEGLVKMDASGGRRVAFRRSDGVLIGGAIPGAQYKDPKSGDLFIGGSWGLNRIDPNRFTLISPPPVVFTSFKRKGREERHLVLPGEALFLGPEDRNFSFKFAALDFVSPNRHRFAYKRAGLDDQWIETQENGFVNYARYLGFKRATTLSVKADNGNGVWREAGLRLNITPPWWIRWLTFIVLVLLAGLVGVIYFAISIRERRKRKKLEEAAELAEQRRKIAEQKARVADQGRAMEERERIRQEEHTLIVQEHLEQVSTEIANDLHDGPLGELHGVGHILHQLRTMLPEDQQKQVQKVTEEMIPRVCHSLRHFCGDLLLPDFRYGLLTELEAYANVIEGLYPGLSVACLFRADDSGLARERHVVIYRIFRTLLKNVGKHAEASQAKAILERADGVLTLTIQDNGRGFRVPANWETFKRQKHYGMYMANYFANVIGGVMTVTSQPGLGTTVEVKAPDPGV